ncbi:MAG TPA: hypothetical protein VJI96_00825 [Candidatus Andersenbacteria bacterium]|nr:hypothetical protein [Candidatus Andersenbacteria bacterium]
MNTKSLSIAIGISVIGICAFVLPARANEIHTANYGAGFLPSPLLTAADTLAPNIAPANFGAGFIGSPELRGGPTTGTVYTAYYGAGFASSPNIIYANSRIRYGHYGAGFLVSPRPWYGYGFWF